MTTLKFRGSHYSAPSGIASTPVNNSNLKYRGAEYSEHQIVPSHRGLKGLKFRGQAY